MEDSKKMMKQFLSMVFAGILGGVLVLTFIPNDAPQQVMDLNTAPSAVFTSNSTASTVPAGNVSFVDASSKVKNSVVHIFAAESSQRAKERAMQNRRSSPFGDFFGNDFFGGDFFDNFYGRKQNGSGSGVIVSEDGYIVTNNHVVGFADEITVTLNDGSERQAKLIGTDKSTDLAVIKIEATGLEEIEYANSDNVQVGEWVLAVGNPYSYLTSTVTAGIVSALGRDLDLIEGAKAIEEFIQTDAAVNPGNSGGALVNTDGNLIGINTAIATPTGVFAGYSFAIPSNLVKRIVVDIVENGNIERTNLGVSGYDVDEDLRSDFKLKTDKGFYVDSVLKGSAAQYAGVLPGDVIIGINNEQIDNYDQLSQALKFNKVGDDVAIEVSRKGKKIELQGKLRKSY